jgi:hypothetical protein
MSASRAGGADWGADGFGDPPPGAASPDPPLDAWAYPHRANSPSISAPENVAYVLVACRGLFDPWRALSDDGDRKLALSFCAYGVS